MSCRLCSKAASTQEQIDQMMVANPVRFFGGAASAGGGEASVAGAAGGAPAG